MKKRMFSKFSSILQHAVDALAPQLSLQEEFVYHWKAVTAYFIDNKGEKLPVEQTNIPAHLEQMLVILQEEEMTSERGMYGPCLEYLLQHKLLETLYSLGRADYPPGMKQIVLSFFTKLLSRIKQPILAHVGVYKAVQRLVNTCGEVQAAPTEIEEIQFLCTVCAKIKADPYLVNFFLEMPKSSANCANSPVVEEPVSGAGNKLFQEFNLVNTLLTLSHSADSRVAVKACEGLILCSSLPEPIAAHCLINSTKFCKDLTQRLVDTFQKLPEAIHPSDLETVQAKWGMDVVTEREDQQTFVGKRHLVSFLSWLDYCDQLTEIANPIVAEALARTIHQKFLIPCVQQALLQASETGAITATAYLTRCLHTVCSERLLSEFVIFLLGEEHGPEVPNSKINTVRGQLIDRCNHVSEEVCLVTLQLFDTLLQKDEEHILNNIVLRNLATRGYYDKSHQSNYRGLPNYIHEEFKNIAKQSESGRFNKNDENHLGGTDIVNTDKCNTDEESTKEGGETSRRKLVFIEEHKAGETGNVDGLRKRESDKIVVGNSSDHSDKKKLLCTDSEQALEKEEEIMPCDIASPGDSAGSAGDGCEIFSDNGQLSTTISLDPSVSEQCAKRSSEHATKTHSITTESSKTEILTKAVCDIDKGLNNKNPSESQNNIEECIKTENSSSSIAAPNKDAENVIEKLESQGVEAQQDVKDEETDNNSSATNEFLTLPPGEKSQQDLGVHGISPRKSRIEVHNIVNCFLSLVPEELKSSYQTSDSGYDMYLRDAHLQYSDIVKACKDWNYPETVTRSQDKDKLEETFYEGDFLHMLLDKLSHLLDQSYPVNLQLTSVISKLALVPHPNLHEFMLDPYLPLRPNVRSLYTVLQKVSNEIKSQLASQPDLGKKLVSVRHQLMSSSPNLNSMRKKLNFTSWIQGQGQLEAIIVLEEFCKELSAIAFIKHHAAVTGQK